MRKRSTGGSRFNERPGEHGGFKEIISRIEGEHVYSQLKFESGVHRVQRVPQTESQGRIHTSACTVAILPEADEVEDIDIPKSDLRIDTYRPPAPAASAREQDRFCRAPHVHSDRARRGVVRTNARNTRTAPARCRCSEPACST